MISSRTGRKAWAATLEEEKSGLARFLATSPEPPALRLHPRMSDLYREKIADLAEALNQPELKPQATELLRGLISEVQVVPAPGIPGGHEIELVGELAGILNLAEADMTKPSHGARAGLGSKSDTVVAGAGYNHNLRGSQVKMVAGTGVDHNLQSTPVKMVAGARTHHNLRSFYRLHPMLLDMEIPVLGEVFRTVA